MLRNYYGCPLETGVRCVDCGAILGIESKRKWASWRKINWALCFARSDKTCFLFSGKFRPLTLSKMHFNERGILITGPFCVVQDSVDSAKPRQEEGLRVCLRRLMDSLYKWEIGKAGLWCWGGGIKGWEKSKERKNRVRLGKKQKCGEKF